jgi:hypothetical protein
LRPTNTRAWIPAPPSDVRKASGLPSAVTRLRGYAPEMGVAPFHKRAAPEGQRPSAHQTAEPLEQRTVHLFAC